MKSIEISSKSLIYHWFFVQENHKAMVFMVLIDFSIGFLLIFRFFRWTQNVFSPRLKRVSYSPSSFHWRYFQSAQLVANNLSESISARLSESVRNSSEFTKLSRKTTYTAQVAMYVHTTTQLPIQSVAIVMRSLSRVSQVIFSHKRVVWSLGKLSESTRMHRKAVGKRRNSSEMSENELFHVWKLPTCLVMFDLKAKAITDSRQGAVRIPL